VWRSPIAAPWCGRGLSPAAGSASAGQSPMRSHLVFYPGRDVEKPASIGKADAVPILHHQPPSGERVPHGARHFGNVEAGKPIAALRGCAPPSS